MSGERLYPLTNTAVNAVYNDGTSAVTNTLPSGGTGLYRIYFPATAYAVFGTASASVNATTPGSAPAAYGGGVWYGTYLVSASGCTLFAVAGLNAGDFTVNIIALASVT